MEPWAEEDNALIRQVKIEGWCPNSCSENFSLDDLLQFSFDSRTLDYYDGTNVLDLVLLGVIRGMARSEYAVKRGNSIVTKESEGLRMMYTLKGISVCENLFFLVHSIKIKRFKRLLKHYKRNCMEPPVHGNLKRTPKKTMTVEETDNVVSFIRNYAEEAALFMPGRLASQYNIVKRLPSSDTKISLHRKYSGICKNNNVQCVGATMLLRIWRTFCSDIVTMEPKSDLCAICQKKLYISLTTSCCIWWG